MALEYRFELRMDDIMANDLESLATDLKTNPADILRRAFALFVEVKSDDDNQVLLKNVKTNKTVQLVNI